MLAQAVGRMKMLMPESLMCEGWVQKESRLLLEWRTRWLVLYRDHVSQLPVLCTFKEARCDWDLAAMPEPTERIDLVGCSCGIQADPSSSTNDLTFSLSLRSVKSLTVSKAAPTHVFTVSNQAATFAFATESMQDTMNTVSYYSSFTTFSFFLRFFSFSNRSFSMRSRLSVFAIPSPELCALTAPVQSALHRQV